MNNLFQKHRKITEEWEIPEYFLENYHKISIGLLKELAIDAEKYLAETAKTAETITHRSQWAGLISFTLVSALIGFLIEGKIDNYGLRMASIFMVMLLSISMVLLLKAWWTHKIHVPGHPPSLTFNEYFVKDMEDDFKNQERLYLINKSRNLEKEIAHNDLINSRRSAKLTIGIFIIPISLFFSLILSYSILGIFGEIASCL